MTKVCECCGKEGTRQLVYRNDVKRHITSYKMCCASSYCEAKLDEQMSDDNTRIAEYHL